MANRSTVKIALLWMSLLSFPCSSAELNGKMVRVLDGDTVEVLTPSNVLWRVRVAGIDSPEKGQPFGNAAKRQMIELGALKEVVVIWQKKDRYQRIVGKVVVGGVDLGLAMIQTGFAWHYKKYEFEQAPADRMNYSAAESQARAAKRGLWADKDPVAPWDYRMRARKPNRSAIDGSGISNANTHVLTLCNFCSTHSELRGCAARA